MVDSNSNDGYLSNIGFICSLTPSSQVIREWDLIWECINMTQMVIFAATISFEVCSFEVEVLKFEVCRQSVAFQVADQTVKGI